MRETGAAIVGWGHTPFGRFDHRSVEDLVVEAARGALATSGVAARDIDTVFLGHFNAGLAPDGFAASLVHQADPALRFVPAARCENACASGSAAVWAALDAIAAGRARIALVVGVEKMSGRPTAEVARALGSAAYQNDPDEARLTFPGIFALFAQAYFARYGDHADTLAMIAAKNHKNALANPRAQMRVDLGFDFCNTVSEKNPLVAAPLRKTDCSLVSDGAAAIVIADAETAAGFARAALFRGRAQVSDFLPLARRDLLAFEGPRRAFHQALAAAGVTLPDLDFAEVHDCFTIAELMTYEAMGLTPPGEGRRALDEGLVTADGALPVNLSGGLKAKGHPVGATGVSMHALAYLQVTGQAGDMQRAGARLGAVFNMGGSAVANYVSILEGRA